MKIELDQEDIDKIKDLKAGDDLSLLKEHLSPITIAIIIAIVLYPREVQAPGPAD